MEQYKIVFSGPVGAGKTTAITTLSDIATDGTDARASDMTAVGETAMDYGILRIGKDERIHLYSTPGQERSDFSWDTLADGGIGLVLLLDNTRSDPFHDMRFFLKAFEQFIGRTKLVIGVTRMDLKPVPCIPDYYKQLHGTGLKPPILEVDARSRQDMVLLVQALLYSLDPGLAG